MSGDKTRTCQTCDLHKKVLKPPILLSLSLWFFCFQRPTLRVLSAKSKRVAGGEEESVVEERRRGICFKVWNLEPLFSLFCRYFSSLTPISSSSRFVFPVDFVYCHFMRMGFDFILSYFCFHQAAVQVGFFVVVLFCSSVMASKRILKELKDLQKDPPTSCSAGTISCSIYTQFIPILVTLYRLLWFTVLYR